MEKNRIPAGVLYRRITTCLLLFFLAGPGNSRAAEELWDMERVVTTALRQSETAIRAAENLYQKELELKMARAFSGGRAGVGAGVTATPATGGDYTVTGRPELSIELPVTPRLKLGAKWNPEEQTRVLLDFEPLAEDTKAAGARRALALAQLEYKKTMVALELQVRQEYINLLSALKNRRRAEEELAVITEYHKIVQRRFDQGFLSEADLRSSEGELLRAGLQLRRSELQEERARLNLSRLLQSDLSRVQFAELPEFPVVEAEREKLLAEALANNVDLQQARLHLAAAREELTRLRQNRPVITLEVTAGKEERPAVSAGFSWTIGFNRREQLEINRINVEQGERAVEGAIITVEDRVTAALADFELERQAMIWLELQLQEAERTYRGMEIRFAAGELRAVELEKARLARDEAFQDYLEGWNRTWKAWYTLLATIAA
ncbi:MAG: TolC family protein [Firmicutes bacterium]|nr:TolC family protein [Bacillota bacterium]